VRVWMDGLGEVDAREERMMVGAEYTRRSVAWDLVDACDRDLADPLVRRSIQDIVEWQAYTSVVRVAPGTDPPREPQSAVQQRAHNGIPRAQRGVQVGAEHHARAVLGIDEPMRKLGRLDEAATAVAELPFPRRRAADIEVSAREHEIVHAGDVRGDRDAALSHVWQEERVRPLERDVREDRVAAIAPVQAVPHGGRVAEAVAHHLGDLDDVRAPRHDPSAMASIERSLGYVAAASIRLLQQQHERAVAAVAEVVPGAVVHAPQQLAEVRATDRHVPADDVEPGDRLRHAWRKIERDGGADVASPRCQLRMQVRLVDRLERGVARRAGEQRAARQAPGRRIAVVVRCGHQPSKRQEERQRATLPTANTSVAPTSVRVESARQPCEPPAEGSTCGLPIWNSPRLGHSAVQQYRTRRVPAPWRVPTTDAFGGAVS